MTKTSKKPEWFIKAAAAAGEVEDNVKVEQAFADQAYQIVANKSGPLMRDPYRMGFEVVWRNDTATRIVGIFASRIGDQLYYVPVFFLQGEICGSDLLYHVSKKKFTPNTEEWVNFLINRDAQTSGLGKGISQEQARRIQPVHYLHRLAGPPQTQGGQGGQTKYAKLGKTSEEWETLLASMCPDTDPETVKSAAAKPSILDQFLSEEGMFVMFTNLLEKHAAFANVALNGPYDVEGFPSRYSPPETVVKQAAAAPARKPELRILRGLADVSDEDELVKLSSAGGFLLVDERDRGTCSQVAIDNLVIKSASDTLKTQKPDELEVCAVTASGVFDILLADGTLKEGLFLPRKDFSWWSGKYSNECSTDGISSGRVYVHDEHCVIWTDKKVTTERRGHYSDETPTPPYGAWVRELQMDDELFTTPAEGKAYQLVDKHSMQAIGDPVLVLSIKKRGGVSLLEIIQYYGGNEAHKVTINPDLEISDLETKTFGKQHGWVEVAFTKHKEDDCCSPCSPCGSTTENGLLTQISRHPGFKVDVGPAIGSESAINQLMFGDTETMSVRITKSASGHMFEMGKAGTVELSKNAAVRFMAQSLGMHGDDIMGVFDLLKTSSKAVIRISIPGDRVVKRASAFVRLTQQPNFTESIEPDFGLVVRSPERFTLATESYSPAPPSARYGDAADPTLGHGHSNSDSERDSDKMRTITNEELMRLQPEELANLAQERKAPSVFDHGMVASLVHMEDAMAYIDKYVPQMEDGLDAIGRMLFMLYFKPADFEQAFGKQEMPAFENDLMSNWKSFGRLVLTLLKRMRVGRDQPSMLKPYDS